MRIGNKLTPNWKRDHIAALFVSSPERACVSQEHNVIELFNLWRCVRACVRLCVRLWLRVFDFPLGNRATSQQGCVYHEATSFFLFSFPAFDGACKHNHHNKRSGRAPQESKNISFNFYL